ncbi:MAG: hypothetical protein V1882_10590 [Candidatus Omnitrophota bacterium]
MSIVYDYLKKIRDQKETKKVAPEVSSGGHKSSSPFPWGKLAVGILACLLMGAGFYFFLPKMKNILQEIRTNTASPQPASVKSRSIQTAVPDFNFLLEGIIYNPSKPFAIIDGKMYETGGRFGDYEVTQITPDTVILKNLKDNTSHTAHL